MRGVLVGVSVVAAGLLFGQQAGAVTAKASGVRAGSAVMLVDDGCGGPQFYRAGNGVCYRKPGYYGAPAYAPPRPPPPPPPYYYRRGCGPDFHMTPYGCRPIW
jgi:hypothetical protein